MMEVLKNGPYKGHFKSTINFCETNSSNVISQPLNTWTNLAYIFVGAILLFVVKREKVPFLKIFAFLPILIGIFSFSLHATNTFWGGSLDLASMFLFSSLLLTNNLNRLGVVKHNKFVLWYVLINISFLLPHFLSIFILGKDLGTQFFGLQLSMVIVSEIYLIFHEKYKTEIHDLLISLTLFGIAVSIWLFDYFKVWCDEDSFHVINGHGIWHILTALSFVPLYFYYHQFFVRKGKWHSRNNLLPEKDEAIF